MTGPRFLLACMGVLAALCAWGAIDHAVRRRRWLRRLREARRQP